MKVGNSISHINGQMNIYMFGEMHSTLSYTHYSFQEISLLVQRQKTGEKSIVFKHPVCAP